MIEDIQKVNALAQELLKAGMATDRADAVVRAEQMLSKNVVNRQQTVSSTNTIEVSKDTEYYKKLVEKAKEEMTAELNLFRNKMNEIISEINEIKKQMNTVATSRSASDAGLNSDCSVKETFKQDKQTELKKPEPHPKRGEWTSNDVAVEKMFYFGHK